MEHFSFKREGAWSLKWRVIERQVGSIFNEMVAVNKRVALMRAAFNERAAGSPRLEGRL